MKKYSKQRLKQLKEISVLTYLKNYAPDDLKKEGRAENYRLKSNHRITFSNGMWHSWDTRQGGVSAISFLEHVEGMQFWDAVNYLDDLVSNHPPVTYIAKQVKNIPLRLPSSAPTNEHIIDYLVNERMVDQAIVDELINQHLIYEEYKTGHVVFVGYNIMNRPKYAFKRSITNNFKQDCLGSSKEFSFHVSESSNTTLHVFEAAIDLISYMSLLKMDHIHYQSFNYLSLSGLGANDHTLPTALSSYLECYPKINYIILHLDNDIPGFEASLNIKNILDDSYKVVIEEPKYGKDINDDLKYVRKYEFQTYM